MANIKICQFQSDKCGNYFIDRNRTAYSQDPLSRVKDLVEDVGSTFGADIVLTECDLIGLRSENKLDRNGWICTHHRFNLGKGYRPSTLCKHFQHKNSTAKGSKVSWELYKFVRASDPQFVLGSLICAKCQKKLREKLDESMECDNDSDAEDSTYVPETVISDDDDKMLRRHQLDDLTNALGVERVRFQINSNIQDMSTSSINYFRHLHAVMQSNLTDKFCSLVAPGQQDELRHILVNSKETETDPVVTHLMEAFGTCNSPSARCAVLSLIPKTFSKAKVAELFGCSVYEISKARRVNKLYGACAIEPKKERVYSRLSIEKARHFIDFLFSTGLLQEVAYGTTKLQFECGDKVTVSDTILNGINEHAVKEYIIHCNEINFERLSRSTLLTLLVKMKPRNRKKLAGIDTFVVDGIEAYEVGVHLIIIRNITTLQLFHRRYE